MKKILSLVLISIFCFSMCANVALALDTGLQYSSILDLGTRGLKAMVFTVINVILGFLGVLAIVIVLIGGFKWMTSGGSEEKIGEARQMIIAGIIGLAIVLAAYAIAQFVVVNLIEATN